MTLTLIASHTLLAASVYPNLNGAGGAGQLKTVIKGDTCAPGADEVLGPALWHLVSGPDAHVRAMAAELVGKFVHTDDSAGTALKTACAQDPSPVVRKKAGWFTPGGTIYQRTIHARPGNGKALNQPPVNGHSRTANVLLMAIGATA